MIIYQPYKVSGRISASNTNVFEKRFYYYFFMPLVCCSLQSFWLALL